MLLEPLQVAPGAPAVLRRRRPFAPGAYGIDASWGRGKERFKTDITFPICPEVIHIPKALPAMKTQVVQPDSMGRGTTAAVFPPVDMETVEMLIAPGKEHLQDRMEVRQGGITGHQYPTPDEGADTPQDDAQLVDAQWCRSRSHALRVA